MNTTGPLLPQEALLEMLARHGLVQILERLQQIAAARRPADESYRIGPYRFVPVRGADGREIGTDCFAPGAAVPVRTLMTDLPGWFEGALYSYLLHCPEDPALAIAFLSHGGREEASLHEVDLLGRVPRTGFDLRCGLHAVAWDGQDQLYLGWRAQEAGEMAYPTEIRALRRGLRYEEAPVLVSAEGAHSIDITTERGDVWQDHVAIWGSTYRARHLVRAAPTAPFRDIGCPPAADVWIKGRHVALLLVDAVADGPFRGAAGSLLLARYDGPGLAKCEVVHRLVEGGAGRAVGRALFALGGLLWSQMDGGRSALYRARLEDGGVEILFGPDAARVALPSRAADAPRSDAADIWVSGFLEPWRCLRGERVDALREVIAEGASFDAGPFRHMLRTAISGDGAAVPYHLVYPADAEGPVPVLIYAYGGFNHQLRPVYHDEIGALWLARGRALAMPLVRGGGELGMAWQAAGRGAGRLGAAADLAAVARELALRALGTPGRIFAWGSSNGGMLVANAALRAPGAFGGIWADKAVLDLRNYDQRGQGAFWTDEYGDPSDMDLMRALSPICNIPEAGALPPFLFTASANDDRVPAEDSMRMAEALIARGHEAHVFLEESGGHLGDPEDPAGTAVGFAFLESLLARHR